MSQFLMGWDPFWAWVCSVLDGQDAIKELLNCISAPSWPAGLRNGFLASRYILIRAPIYCLEGIVKQAGTSADLVGRDGHRHLDGLPNDQTDACK